MAFRTKRSNHAFLLLALLPVLKFIHKDRPICGVLESRMIHECLDFILQPPRTTFSLLKIQTTANFGPTAASKMSHLLVCPSHPTDFPTRFQGIISPSCALFFVPSHPEEPNILLVQIYFSRMLSVSILYLSCLQLAKDNRTRRARIQCRQLGCIF
jgi:Plavaka transposase